MSSATATADAAVPAAPKSGGKKLVLILVIVVLLLAAAGGAAFFLLKKKAAGAEDGADEAAASHAAVDLKHPPTFVPLDPLVVNLADRDADRYAQIGVSLELADAKAAEQIKPFMPAIRNNVLMVLSHKSSADLLAKNGKQALATDIRIEATRALGFEVRVPKKKAAPAAGADSAAAATDAHEEDDPDYEPRRPRIPGPIRGVQFTNFIIQ